MTEYARNRYVVTGHNNPGLAGTVTHILEPQRTATGFPGPMPGNQPNIETPSSSVLAVGTVIETVSTWAVVV